MEDLAGLKARAYDLIRQLEAIRAELQRVNNSIAQLEKQPEGKDG